MEQRGAHEGGGRAQGVGATPYLVACWKLLLRRVQVSWIMFVPKIMFPKVSFRLIFFVCETLKWAKNSNSGLGLWLIG